MKKSSNWGVCLEEKEPTNIAKGFFFLMSAPHPNILHTTRILMWCFRATHTLMFVSATTIIIIVYV